MNEETPIKMLKKDHRKVEELFTECYGTNDAQERADLVNKIASELEVHMKLEEELFYPEVERVSAEGLALVEHSRSEHQKMKDIISELKHRSDIETNDEIKLRELDMIMSEHVKEEEQKMFPLAEKELKDELGLGFSAKMFALKQKLKLQS